MADPKDRKREEDERLEEEEELEEIDEGGEEEEEDREGEQDEEEEEEERETLTVDELQEQLAKAEEERDGVRRELFRTRERARLLRTRALQEPLYEPSRRPEEEEREEPGDDRIEVEMGEDGKLTIPRTALLKQTERATTPRRPEQSPAARAIVEATQSYQRQRATLIDEAEDPLQASDALDELEMAYGFLDRMVGTVVQEIGVLPQGEDSLRELITSEGLDRRFARRFPGIPWQKLLHAPNDAHVLRELVQKQQGKSSQRREDERGEEEERSERVLRSGQRPRSMRRRRRKAKPKVSGKALEEMDPEDLLALSDEEAEELART
jgi:hypothetical protein